MAECSENLGKDVSFQNQRLRKSQTELAKKKKKVHTLTQTLIIKLIKITKNCDRSQMGEK